MDEGNVALQLKQMMDFIRMEAVEKASEIEAAAAEEFQIEKLQLVEAEKKKIRQDYGKKEKQVAIKKKLNTQCSSMLPELKFFKLKMI